MKRKRKVESLLFHAARPVFSPQASIITKMLQNAPSARPGFPYVNLARLEFEGILLESRVTAFGGLPYFLLLTEGLSSDHGKKSIEKMLPMKYDGFREYKRRSYAKTRMPKL